MKILYDHQIFTLQSYGGISRYFCELMDQFSRAPDIEQTLALRYSYNENLCSRYSLNRHWSSRSKFLCGTQIFPVIRKISHVDVLNCLRINQRESMRLLETRGFDVFHPTDYDRGHPNILPIMILHARWINPMNECSYRSYRGTIFLNASIQLKNRSTALRFL